MNEKTNLIAMETADLVAQYFGQYADKVSAMAVGDATIYKVLKAFDGFDPYQVAQIIRKGIANATASMEKELLQLQEDNMRLTTLLNEMELNFDDSGIETL